MVLLCKVQIDGTTVRDDSSTEKKVISWEYEKTSEIMISELTMTLLASVADLVTITPGKTIEVWTGFTTSTDLKVFSGFIEEANPTNGRLELSCKDKMWDLVRRNVNTVYESTGTQAGVISAIATDLIETYGGLTASVQATGSLDTDKIDEFRCDNTDVWERLMALAKAVDYQMFYDAVNDTVHFEPKGFSDSGETLTVGTEVLGIPNWSNDTSRMINDLRVDGAMSQTQIRLPSGTGVGQIDTTANFDTDGITLTKTPESVELIMDASTPPTTVTIGGTKDASSSNFYYIDQQNKKIMPATGTTFTVDHYAIVNYTWFAPSPIHQINQNSIDTYGKFEKQVTLQDIQTVADGEVRTSEILSKLSTPFLIGNMKVKSSSTIVLDVGDRVVISDSVSTPNILQELVITKQVIKYPGSFQEITVGDETLRLADWQINVEERLKRIEEQLSLKNQDLLLELRDFNNTLTLSARYRWITTRDTSTDYVWNRSNWGTAKWDGTYANSMVNNYIEQYLNSYEETFIDIDFFDDPNSTGDWLTGVITVGQTLRSLPFDFNNGTVTSATATFTESGPGTPTFYLSANGGSNWEVVTSGTAHTFTNTGTSLMWRIDSASDTTTVTKVEVTDYH